MGPFDFAPAANYAAVDGATAVALGDLNGDGRLDLATANVSSDNASVLLNQLAPASITASAPSGAVVGAPFSVTATVYDGCGALLAGYNGPVSVAIKAGTGAPGALLGGTTTVNAVGGIATFSGLTIDRGGDGYKLTATAGTASGDSPAFDVDTPPVASSTPLTVAEDGPASGTLAATDADGDALTYSIVANGAKGIATITNPATGAFTYMPNPDANGGDSFTFKAHAGALDSNTATISITIAAVNDAPSFTPGASQTVLSTAGAQTLAGWARGFMPGPADEAGQTLLGYQVVSNSNPALFAAAPALAADGTLTYSPKPSTGGTATIGVVGRDSGGTANGGIDTSAVRSFTITVKPLYRLYLTQVSQTATPDLAVTSISLIPIKSNFAAGEPVEVRVTVTNQGNAPAAPFWVDLSINPDQPPTAANQIWNQHCTLVPCYGMAWYVKDGLAPGASVTLTSQNLPAGYSTWPGAFAAGTTDLYAYADSYSPGAAAGTVAESNETNNQLHLGGLTVTGPNPAQVRRQAAADLRARPLHLGK